MEGTASRVEVAELRDAGELKDLARILNSIWERTALPLLTPELLRALSHAGNYVVGARQEGRLVGGLVGFWGRHGAGWCLHSHILGVQPGAQARGIGYGLKQHQRTWTLAHGVSIVRWTFDPLVRRNAYFNLSKLGAAVVEYQANFYGRMADSINADDETDRVVVSWDLGREGAARTARETGLEELREAGAGVALAADEESRPVRFPISGELVLCQVPMDIVELRRSRPDLAREWRLALRETLGEELAGRATVRRMTRDGWYVVERGGRGR